MQDTSTTDRATLADAQASLRRIATLVAEGAKAGELFSAVAREVSVVLDVPVVTVGRYELEGGLPVSVVLASREHARFPVGSRWPLDGAGTREIYENRRPIRIEDFSGLEGTLASAARQEGMSWVVGAPIIVDGAVWGNIYAGTTGHEPIPNDAESRLADFTDLVSTAIANSDAREKVGRLLDQQAALRRVATLVARGAPPHDVLDAVAVEAGRLLGADLTLLQRADEGGGATVLAWRPDGMAQDLPISTQPTIDPESLTATVLRTGLPARIDYAEAPGPWAAEVRKLGFRSAVGAPVTVEGRLWGVMIVTTTDAHAWSPDAEDRLAEFTELVATAIANAESRGELAGSEARARELAEEQAALRRVATLVARAPASEDLLSTVAREVASVLKVPGVLVDRFEADGTIVTVGATFDSDLAGAARVFSLGTRMPPTPGSLAAQVFETHRAARVDDFSTLPGPIGDLARAAGLGSGSGGPIVVNGDLWGLMCVFSPRGTVLPAGTEYRLHDFIELVATAIANYEARADLAASEARARELAEEQAALRRVATLVAEGAAAEDLFAAVAREVANLFGVGMVNIDRYENGESVVVASVDNPGFPVGSRWPLDGPGVRTIVYETGRTARVDDFTGIAGTAPAAARAWGIKSAVAVPIVVDAEVWGVLGFGWKEDEPLPADTEQRLAAFTELVSTAIANAQSRGELAASEARARELAEEQLALRRVATLVAEGAPPNEVLDAVAVEVGRLIGGDLAVLSRFEQGGGVTVLSSRPEGTAREPPFAAPTIDPESLTAAVMRTGRPARIDDFGEAPGPWSAKAVELGRRSAVAAPLTVQGSLWGVMAVVSTEAHAWPHDTEDRLAAFTELLATAIANTESREQLAASEARARELASEQAALRRVATLVAQGASPGELFSAVAKEVARIIDIPVVGIHRYDPDGTVTTLGIAGETSLTIGTRLRVTDGGIAAMILATGRPSRMDDYSSVPRDAVREDLRLPMVGVPIVVEGSVWGFMVAAAKRGRHIPAGTEERLARFTELVATAVSNATTRSELLTSRARVVSAADETRRRLERDLHDGIQQWLVALALRARTAAGLSAAGESAAEELSGLADDLVAVTDELREISRGIHPAILSEAGLDDALKSLARRSAIPVDLEVSFEGRYDPTIEATVYYVVAESITNAVKHAQASTVNVRGAWRDGAVELEIGDDGVGGADPRGGTGLIGLKDRVDTLGGTISFASPPGAGTTIRVNLPAGPRDGEDPALTRPDEAGSAPASG